MLYPYLGSVDRPVWKLALPRGDYAFAPTAARPGGPVLFTSDVTARRFLAYHAARWGRLAGAVPMPVPGGLREALTRWRTSVEGAGVALPDFAFCYIDPRAPLGGGGEVDAQVVQATRITPAGALRAS